MTLEYSMQTFKSKIAHSPLNLCVFYLFYLKLWPFIGLTSVLEVKKQFYFCQFCLIIGLYLHLLSII